MNKTAIRNFATWARSKLIADITYKAGLLGITEKGIQNPLPQSTDTVYFFDIGLQEPSPVTGVEIEQRQKLVERIRRREKQGSYTEALGSVIEEVAYTWFNRLIAIRFMEVNDYLPTRIRVLSSESGGKMEPDLVTYALEADLEYSAYEKDRIVQLKQENKLDELFRLLFIKQCNALNKVLPGLFEPVSDYTELLLNISFTDQDGVLYHLVNDIPEDNFDVSKKGQVEIIGWLYQYYNTEPKAAVDAYVKKGKKVKRDDVPAKTQLFTPNWIVRYMVENSLGRLWLEGHPNEDLKSNWRYYLDEAKQDPDVQKRLDKMRNEHRKDLRPEDVKIMDPAMGSGHILVYAFEVLMRIYESCGYSQRDAAQSIIKHNLYGLDIDNRARQLAYFAVMMKARQYNRRILDGNNGCHVYTIRESNDINRNQLKYFGANLGDLERNMALLQIQELLDVFLDAKYYGSILNVAEYNWGILRDFSGSIDLGGQISTDTMGIENTGQQLRELIEIAEVMARKYDVVVTNPPYLGLSNMNAKLSRFVGENYPQSKSDLFAVFMVKCGGMLKATGYTAMITQDVWMYKTAYFGLRGKLLNRQLGSLVDLGANIFEALTGEIVQSVAFVYTINLVRGFTSTFVKLTQYEAEEKEKEFVGTCNRYYIEQEKFKFVSEYIYTAYSACGRVLDILAKTPALETFAYARKGLTTGDNDRFVRLWWEIGANRFSVFVPSARWFPMTKGGSFRKWYGNNSHVVNWENDGLEIKCFKDANGKLKSRPQNLKFYFREGASWNDTASKDIAFRYQSDQYIPNASGPCVYSGKVDVFYLMGMFNSKVSQAFLNVLAIGLKYEVGQVGRFPVLYSVGHENPIRKHVKTCVGVSWGDWDSFETSWDFQHHPLLKYTADKVRHSYIDWRDFAEDQFQQLKANEEELNRIFIDIYGLRGELTPDVADKDVTITRIYDTKEDIPEGMKGNNYVLTKADVVKSFISYAVGCVFGRYSLDVDGLVYAGGEWDSSKYSTFIPKKDNILPITDEEYYEDDMVGRFVSFLEKVYGPDTLDENLSFIADALGSKGNTSRQVIRNYFLADFFKDHCTTYSVRGAGKRPIYWQFDSGRQNGFKALIYMHRYDEDTIGRLRIDYLHRIQRVYESEISRMQDTIDNGTNAREVATATKRKEKLIKQLQETKEYDTRIAHLAVERISIDLDDGVKVNYQKIQTDRDGKKHQVLKKI